MAHVAAAVPPVIPHVLIQLVFVPKRLPALEAFKGSKGLTNKKMLESGILGKGRERMEEWTRLQHDDWVGIPSRGR